MKATSLGGVATISIQQLVSHALALTFSSFISSTVSSFCISSNNNMNIFKVNYKGTLKTSSPHTPNFNNKHNF